MMAAVEVVRETPEKDEQSATEAPPATPMHH